MYRCFIASLRFAILPQSGRGRGGVFRLLRLAFQLVHLRREHQVNGFMGCDCHIDRVFSRFIDLFNLPPKRAALSRAEVQLTAACALVGSSSR
jgi:hypothetical protein